MADPRGKLPENLGSTDWDSLLSDIERKDESPAKASPSKAPEPNPPTSVRGGAPLYRPPSATPTPAPARMRSAPPPLPLDNSEEEEERTVVGVISRELIEEASRNAGGLGQFLNKPDKRSSDLDGIDIDLGDSGDRATSLALDEGVVTSAPDFSVPGSEHDRATPVPSSSQAALEHPDPFAPPPAKAAPPALPKAGPPALPKAAPPALPRAAPPALPRQARPEPPPPRASAPTIEPEDDEVTRIGQVLPADIDRAALQAELLGTSAKAESTPLPVPEARKTGEVPPSSKKTAPVSTPRPAEVVPEAKAPEPTPEAPSAEPVKAETPKPEPVKAAPKAPPSRPTAPSATSTPRPPPAKPAAKVDPKITEQPTAAAPEITEIDLPPASIEPGPMSTGERAIPAVRPDLDLSDERDAVAFLAEVDALQDWAERAAWMEQEARRLEDKGAKARMLLTVSELLAMTGEEERAQALAEEARGLAPSLQLSHQQTRARLARERGFEALIEPLEVEIRSAPTAVSRAHAANLAGEIYRLVSKNGELAAKKYEQAARVLPQDPRAHLMRVASELGQNGKPLRYHWPKEPALAALAAATEAHCALRGAFDKEAAPASAAEAVVRARAALGEGNFAGAAEALASLGSSDGVGRAALWLASVLAAPRAATRARASGWAAQVAEHDEAARRRSALWAFESGDIEKTTEALAGDAFGGAERAAARALLGADAAQLAGDIAALAADDEQRPLASALASALSAASPPEAGSMAVRASAALGRGLAAGGAAAASAIREVASLAPDDVAAQTLLLDANVAEKRGSDVAAGVAVWPRSDGAPVEFDRDRSIATAFLHVAAGSTDAAVQELSNAREADPLHEATVRLLAALAPRQGEAEIDKLAAEVEDPARRALLLIEAASHKGAASDAYNALLRLAQETLPELPIAAAMGLEAARRAGDVEAVLGWLRTRLEAERNPGDLIREALALQAESPQRAAERVAEALQSNEDDIVLRELAERLAPSQVDPTWRASRAPKATPPARALLAFRAALDLERSGDFAGASQLALMAAESGGGELSKLLRDRCDAAGPGATRLTEELIAAAKEPADLVAEREAYERLAALDEVGRNDPAGALQWHRALLERDPSWLPSLNALEHRMISESREDELESVLIAVAQANPGAEASAHAQVAARLRLRTAPWESTRDLVDLALKQPSPSVWALRQAQAHARFSADAAVARKVSVALGERTLHEGERATLLLRAAEAAEQTGDAPGAVGYLRSAAELAPNHQVVLTALADLLERTGEPADAAQALAAAARSHQNPAHQAPLWYRAAILWLDKVNDKEHGTPALEAVAAVDPSFGETFDRLRALYTERKEGEKLATLLQRRLETEENPERRVELEVALGRALTEMGDRQAAKRALAAALDSSPDHVDALRAFVDLCAAEEDWENAEQALIRLGRLVADPQEQAGLYVRLGDIYRLHLPNFERAEVAYLEVLKRTPESPTAQERLVKLYAAQGNKEKALELQNALLAAAAANPVDKRTRTIELAMLHEEACGDPKKAEQILEGLRKEFPHETQVLRALAEFHMRHNHGPAVNVLLDRAAADARRALSTGRFELQFFANLATVFELRGNAEAALTANGSVAALDGRPCEVQGIGLRGAEPGYDDLLAPEIFTPAFRSLLQRSAALLDAAFAVDAKALRASPLPPTSASVHQRAQQLAGAFGIDEVQILVAPTLPAACLPISTSNPTIVLNAGLLAEQHEAARTFLLLRALKSLQTGVAVFSRTAPIDLWPLTAALLQHHAPSWTPQGVDANKLKDFKARLQKTGIASSPDLVALATEVGNGIGNRASTLQTSANSWGARTALLVTGDVSTAIDAIAWAAGQPAGAPATNPDRMKWIGRNAEARDLIGFSVSDGYSEARSR